jgi:hypothetical protein
MIQSGYRAAVGLIVFPPLVTRMSHFLWSPRRLNQATLTDEAERIELMHRASTDPLIAMGVGLVIWWLWGRPALRRHDGAFPGAGVGVWGPLCAMVAVEGMRFVGWFPGYLGVVQAIALCAGWLGIFVSGGYALRVGRDLFASS